MDYNELKEDVDKERKIVPVNEILKMTEREEPFLVDRMIVENSINALTSDSGKGKSLIALKLAEAIVRGEDFLGEYKTKKGNVLIMDMEMSSNDVIQRTKSVVQTEIEGLDFYHCQTFDIEDEGDFKWLVSQIKERKYALIIFDTLSAIHSKDENSNTLMNQVNKKLLELTNKVGTTVLFIHHHRKAQSGEQYAQASSRGASSIIDKAGSHLLLDSNEITVIEDKKDFQGLKITIEQHKARQVKRLTRFAIKVFYNPFKKTSIFEWLGNEEKNESALKKAKGVILKFMESGHDYTIQGFMEIENAPNPRIMREAVRELTKESVVIYRYPVKGVDDYIGNTKVRSNTKIYSLKEEEEEEKV